MQQNKCLFCQLPVMQNVLTKLVGVEPMVCWLKCQTFPLYMQKLSSLMHRAVFLLPRQVSYLYLMEVSTQKRKNMTSISDRCLTFYSRNLLFVYQQPEHHLERRQLITQMILFLLLYFFIFYIFCTLQRGTLFQKLATN